MADVFTPEKCSGAADSRVLAVITELLGQQVTHRKWLIIAVHASDRIPAALESRFLTHDGSPDTTSAKLRRYRP